MAVFSVIMPCYNSARFVDEAIASVVAQTWTDWELLIVDDGSVDGTVALCREWERRDGRICLTALEHNQGAARARNRAIEQAEGRFIAFLDSDDLWYPDKLERQLPVFDQEDVALVYSAYDVIDAEARSVLRTVKCPPRLAGRDLYRGDPIGCLTAVYDVSRTGKLYMPDIRQRQDWGLWLRVVARHDGGVGLEQPLAALRLRLGSLSANKLRATYYSWRLLRDEAGLGRFAAALGVASHLVTAVGRRIPGRRAA